MILTWLCAGVKSESERRGTPVRYRVGGLTKNRFMCKEVEQCSGNLRFGHKEVELGSVGRCLYLNPGYAAFQLQISTVVNIIHFLIFDNYKGVTLC